MHVIPQPYYAQETDWGVLHHAWTVVSVIAADYLLYLWFCQKRLMIVRCFPQLLPQRLIFNQAGEKNQKPSIHPIKTAN